MTNLNEMFNRRIGDCILNLHLTAGLGIWLAPTGPEGHFTVWGRAGDLYDCIRGVLPIAD